MGWWPPDGPPPLATGPLLPHPRGLSVTFNKATLGVETVTATEYDQAPTTKDGGSGVTSSHGLLHTLIPS